MSRLISSSRDPRCSSATACAAVTPLARFQSTRLNTAEASPNNAAAPARASPAIPYESGLVATSTGRSTWGSVLSGAGPVARASAGSPFAGTLGVKTSNGVVAAKLPAATGHAACRCGPDCDFPDGKYTLHCQWNGLITSILDCCEYCR